MKTKLIIPKRIKAWAEEFPRIEELLGTEYGEALMQAYNSLDTDMLYRSRTHGVGHIERALLFGAMIAQNLQLDEDMTKQLLLCCSYHDIGRVDDSYDLEHGRRSAEMIENTYLKELFPDVHLAKAAIAAHAVPDGEMKGIGELYGVTDEEKYRLLTRCLKDADNLDRVRIADLDTKHLRHQSTVEMVPLATAVFNKYIENPKMTDFTREIYNQVMKIPPGQVACYGQIAFLAGRPGASRAVGAALHNNPRPRVIPCHRVVFKDGSVTQSFAFGGPGVQRLLLEREGIEFGPDGKIDMTRYMYKPDQK